MTQLRTQRDHFVTRPGDFASYPRGTEDILVPISRQTIRIVAGPDDPVAAGDYNILLRLQGGGPDVTLATPYTSPGEPAASFATNFAAALQADPAFRARWVQNPIVAAGLNIDLSPYSGFVTYQIVQLTQPAGNNVSASQIVAAGGANLPVGVFYAYDAPFASAPGNAAQGNQRRAFPARSLEAGDTISTIRGVVGLEPLSITQGPDFFDPSGDLDAYKPGATAPGLLDGEVDVLVDPSSARIDDSFLIPGAPPLYAVLAAGLNLQVGAITTVADGGNTVQVNVADALGSLYARPIMPETAGATTIGGQSVRAVRCKIDRTN